MEIARSYFITLNLLYGKLFHTHFVHSSAVSGYHGRRRRQWQWVPPRPRRQWVLDGGGYIYNRGGAHSSYDDRRHRLTVTTLVTTARARAAAVSCSAFVGGVAGVSHTGIFVCFFA